MTGRKLALKLGIWRWFWWAVMISIPLDIAAVFYAIHNQALTDGIFLKFLMLFALKAVWLIFLSDSERR